MSPLPFEICTPQEVLTDLHARLSRTRFATRTAENWRAGTDPDYLRELVAYWRDSFDWRARERLLNETPQFIANIGGQRVHFAHVRGRRAPGAPEPIALFMPHGWPSAFIEMLPMVPLLTDPGSHGGDPLDAFDLVIPSLPGVAFSDLPASGPLTRPVMADSFAHLLTDVLGYARFGTYGGDVGADVSHWLAARYPERVIGLHLIRPRLPSNLDNLDGATEAEREYIARSDRQSADDSAYSHMQATRPDTIAAALLDSPAGLAAWIIEKLRAWSDCDGDIERRFSKDQLLTLLTIYWVTGSIGTSFRSYYDFAAGPPRPKVTVPTAITLTAEDRPSYPRELAERLYSDIRLWNDPGPGGHFLPMEEPVRLAEDIKSFFRPLRSV